MMTLESIQRRLSLMVARVIIKAIKADGGRILLDVDGLEDETSEACELAEPWGLTSAPLDGAEGVALSAMSERGHRIILSMGDRRHRPTDLEPGESCLFDDRGNRIYIRRDRIKIVAPERIEITTPHATINGEAIATVTHEVQVAYGSSAGRHQIVTGVGDGG